MRKWLVIAWLVLLAGHAIAANYYVSPTGNNANAGTSTGSPWLTVAKVNATTFVGDDVIHFQQGGQWRETLIPKNGGTSGHPITYTSYGTSSQPIFNGSDLITGWASDTAPIYSVAQSTAVRNVYVDNPAGWGLNTACCKTGGCSVTGDCAQGAMTAGSWFWDSGANKLYVWLLDGSNPTSHTVEAATRLDAFSINTSDTTCKFCWITVSNLHFTKSYGYSMLIHDTAASGSSGGLNGIVIDSNTTDHSGTNAVDGGEYYNQIYYNDETGNSDPDTAITNNYLSWCGTHNCLQAQNSDNYVVSGNNVTAWNHNGIDVKGSAGVLVHDNYVHDFPTFGAAFYIESTVAKNSSITWYHNSAYNVSNGFTCSGQFIAGGTLTCNAYNNTYGAPLPGGGTAFSTGSSSSVATTTFNVKNNIVMNSSAGLFNPDSTHITFAFDFNDYWPDPPPNGWKINNVTKTKAQWIALGQETNSLFSNPLFASLQPAYRLTAASPAVNAGTNLTYGLNIGANQLAGDTIAVCGQ